jgi:hypothetical protein
MVESGFQSCESALYFILGKISFTKIVLNAIQMVNHFHAILASSHRT